MALDGGQKPIHKEKEGGEKGREDGHQFEGR